MALVYAKEGYRFYSVITPFVAVEYELPIGHLDGEDKRRYDQLTETSERHGAPIQASTYALL
jgi:hypothetical protein